MGRIGGTVEHDTWDWLGHERLAAGEHAELQPVYERGASVSLRSLRRAGAAAMRVRHERAGVQGRAQLGHGGNGRLRTAMYLASLSATRYNPAIKVFYERLRAKGKPMKVAWCAAARKLLHMAWWVVKKGQGFEAMYGQAVSAPVSAPAPSAPLTAGGLAA